MFAAVTLLSGPRVRHYEGLPDSPHRRDLPRPTVALIDETREGFYLIRLTDDGTFCGDTWHPSADEARGQAAFEFDRVGTWHQIPAHVADSRSYAIQHVKTG